MRFTQPASIQCRSASLLQICVCLVVGYGLPAVAVGQQTQKQTRLDLAFDEGQASDDVRLGPLRNLRDKFHPWSPPETAEEWKVESKRIREQLLVSNGLWPLPEKTPLKAVIHGRIDKGDYVVDKVFFASRPGHYVSGLLYRPKDIKGKVPAILTPHGHWPNGRFYDAGAKTAGEQMEKKAETLQCAARFPLQARMVQLARMGCIVFHYDMIGYADSKTLDHRTGFSDINAGFHSQNLMGLQTWNSIRALDFVESLPEVDPKRIAVTGASGGGTQTFVLCAIDDRPAAAFPAVMVSTNMQGGCVCENADHLRVDINNIAIAALCAPRPMALSGADDWTVDILTKGQPELKKVYSFFDASDNFAVKAWPKFGHNYNAVSRAFMYEWFNRHLKLGKTAAELVEKEFEPLTTEQAAVFDKSHPRPSDSLPVDALRERLSSEAVAWWMGQSPMAKDQIPAYRETVATAVNVILGKIPPAKTVKVERLHRHQDSDLQVHNGIAKRGKESVPYATVFSNDFDGAVVLWITKSGKADLFNKGGTSVREPIRKLVESGAMVVSIDTFLTGENSHSDAAKNVQVVDKTFPGYTFGYNRSLLANRVRDILTAVSALKDIEQVKSIHLVGTDGAGPWVLLASSTGMPESTRTIVNCEAFQFSDIKVVTDMNYLPGALRYGGLGGMAALVPPQSLTIASTNPNAADQFSITSRLARLQGAKLDLRMQALTDDEIVELLVGR